MKAIILAAGEGTRLRPLTNKKPKVMVELAGKPIVEHNLEKLPEELDEIIFVVNYKKEQIINYFGNSFAGKKITYIEQEKLDGTGGAVDRCRDLVDSKFLVLMGDNVYTKKDIERCLEYENSMLVVEKDGPIAGGNVVVDENDKLLEIQEGKHEGKILFNAALHVISPEYFDYEPVEWKPGEFGLPQTIVKMAQDHDVKIVKTDNWLQINTIEELEEAEKQL